MLLPAQVWFKWCRGAGGCFAPGCLASVAAGLCPPCHVLFCLAELAFPTPWQVRLSLDTDLHMVAEAGAPRAPGDWCRCAPATCLDLTCCGLP